MPKEGFIEMRRIESGESVCSGNFNEKSATEVVHNDQIIYLLVCKCNLKPVENGQKVTLKLLLLCSRHDSTGNILEYYLSV